MADLLNLIELSSATANEYSRSLPIIKLRHPTLASVKILEDSLVSRVHMAEQLSNAMLQNQDIDHLAIYKESVDLATTLLDDFSNIVKSRAKECQVPPSVASIVPGSKDLN